MNATLSFNAHNVNGTALFESICTKLSDLTKENIVLGAVPEKTLSDVLITRAFPSISITNLKADVALNQLLGHQVLLLGIILRLFMTPELVQFSYMLMAPQ